MQYFQNACLSSPELKARVSYCHRAPSVVRPLRSIATHRDHFVRRPSVRLSVRLSHFSVTLSKAMFRRRHIHSSECCHYFFSSPEPKTRVSYCHRAPSVVRPSVRRRRCRCPSVNFSHFRLLLKTARWILMKLVRDEVLMVPYKCCCFSARSAQGRIQGRAKVGHGGMGVPFFNELLLQTGRL